VNVLTKSDGKPSNLHVSPINSFKGKRSSRKTSVSFRLLKIYKVNVSRIHWGMCQLEKLWANEITEPLAFTVCKLELDRKAIVLQSCSRHTWFNRGQLWEKPKATSFFRTKTNQGALVLRGFKEAHILAVVNKGQNERKKWTSKKKNKPRRKYWSIVSKMHGGIYFVQWRIRWRRIIQTRFWKSLSRNIAFFCFPLFFLIDCWYIQRWSISCFAFWDLIEPRDLVTFSKILPYEGWNSSSFFMFRPGFVLLLM